MKYLKKKSWRIVAMFAATALFLVWIGNPVVRNQPEVFESNTSVSSVLHDYQFSGTIPESMIDDSDTGFISMVFGDEQNANGEAEVMTFFTNDEGEMYQVETRQPTEFLAYNGDYVAAEYLVESYDTTNEAAVPTIHIYSLTPMLNDEVSAAVTGNTRWVNIACRFSDMDDVTPRPIEYFESILVNQAPGMDDYWRTTSAQLVNIEGSGAFGWYDLPKTKNEYLRMASANTGNALRALMNDCVSAVRAADNVDFTQFGGINMMLNDTFGCCAWGGRMGVNVGGQTVQFRTTWLPPWAFNSLHVIAHEMGHGWGLPHSSGPYGKVYDSAWDVMSGGNSNHTDAICRVGNDLGCWQVGTIGFHLAMLGWIPEDQMVVVDKGESATIQLDALTNLETATNDMLVLVPISGNTFYTVEARAFIDYDRNLPGEAVVLHQVVPGRASPAHVVDADNNGNPNDEGAMWRVGETFTDSRANITVEVLSNANNVVTVRISNGN